MKPRAGRAAWTSWRSGSHRASGGSSRAAVPWPTCAGCWRPWAQERLAAGGSRGRPRRRTGCGTSWAGCAGTRTRSATTCGPPSSSGWAAPARAGAGRDRVREEGREVGGRAAAVQRHRGPGREPSIGVVLGYAGREGHALIDRALYLPEGWAGDAGRRAGAGVPEEVAFTKPKLGAAMLERALDAGVPCSWVTGDSVYGADRALRRRIEARGGLGYVLAVTSGQRLGGRRVDAWAAGVPPEGWLRLRACEGCKRAPAGLVDRAHTRGAVAPGARRCIWRRAASRPACRRTSLTSRFELTASAVLDRTLGVLVPDLASPAGGAAADGGDDRDPSFKTGPQRGPRGYDAHKKVKGRERVLMDEVEVNRSGTGWYRHVQDPRARHAGAGPRRPPLGPDGRLVLGLRRRPLRRAAARHARPVARGAVGSLVSSSSRGAGSRADVRLPAALAPPARRRRDEQRDLAAHDRARLAVHDRHRLERMLQA